MRPPKIDFRFLYYTSKNMYLKKTFLNANLLEKYQNSSQLSDAYIILPYISKFT